VFWVEVALNFLSIFHIFTKKYIKFRKNIENFSNLKYNINKKVLKEMIMEV